VGTGARAARPGLVRLLFAVCILWFIAGALIRKGVGQPYPVLTMPAFSGIGLLKMTHDEGEVYVEQIQIRFADKTTVELRPVEFFGDDFFPSVLPGKYFVLGRGTNRDGPLPQDAKQFLATRLEKLYPSRPVASVTFQVLRMVFPLDRPKELTVAEVADERVFSFSP